MTYPRFRHEVIVERTPGTENDVCLLADLTGNGWLDVIVVGKPYKPGAWVDVWWNTW